MHSRWNDYRLFLSEFRRTFHSTGAVLPSGRQLCRALARYAEETGQPRRLLEIGPGTGVVTDCIIRRMGSDDHLELVELNDRFVELLRRRLEEDPTWRRAADRVRVTHAPIEKLNAESRYDALVSGLPLNNFAAATVRDILGKLQRLVAPGGTLSFFEYVGIRKAKSLAARRDERRRLAGVEQALRTALAQHARERQCILSNVPPAWVHHLQFSGDEPLLFTEATTSDVETNSAPVI